MCIKSVTIYGQALEQKDDHPMGIINFRVVPCVGSTCTFPLEHVKTPVAWGRLSPQDGEVAFRTCVSRRHGGAILPCHPVDDSVE
jgi:hypothetical protein